MARVLLTHEFIRGGHILDITKKINNKKIHYFLGFTFGLGRELVGVKEGVFEGGEGAG